VNDAGEKSWVQGANASAAGGQETQYRLIYLIKMEDYASQLPLLEKILNSSEKQ